MKVLKSLEEKKEYRYFLSSLSLEGFEHTPIYMPDSIEKGEGFGRLND